MAKLTEKQKENWAAAGDYMNAGAGLMSMAGGIISSGYSSRSNPYRYDKYDRKSDMTSGITTGISTGASLGTAIAPGIGTLVGAGIGAIGGAIMGDINADKAEKQQRTTDILDTNAASADAANLAANMQKKNRIYTHSYGIPGFDSGIGKFYSNSNHGKHNANLSPEEAILNPDGSIGIVPGKYDQSNPDNVKASISDGTGVLPKNSKFKLPYGKSTPADIGKRMSRIQNKSRETMMKIRVSKIDRNTAALNNNNIENAKVKLSNFVELVKSNEPGASKPENYDYGKYYNAGAIGIAAYNALDQNVNAIPEVFTPTYSQYMPMKYTSSLSQRLEDIRMRDNISKYNSRISGRNTGMSSAINAASNYNTNRAVESAFASDYRNIIQNENMNNQLFYNNYNMNLAEKRRIDDINARSRAAARGIKYDSISNLASIISPRPYQTSSISPSEFESYMDAYYRRKKAGDNK